MSEIDTLSMSKAPRPAPVTLVWVVLGIAWGAFLLPQAGSGLLIGWPLNLVAFCLAIVIMVRGRTAAGILAMAASVVVSPLIYLLGLLFLLLTTAFHDIDIDIQESGPVREHHAPPPVEAPSLQMTALSSEWNYPEISGISAAVYDRQA